MIKNKLGGLFSDVLKIKTKGSFVQNVSIVFSGNVLNLVIQLGLTPIISRVYAPEAYGQFAFYNLIISNVVFFTSMALPSIYILPKTRVEFLSLSKVVVYLMISITMGLVLFYILFEGFFFEFDGDYLVILIMIFNVLFGGFNAVLGSWNARSKKFARNTSAGVLSNFNAKIASFTFGYFVMSSGFGLLLGDAIRSTTLFILQTPIRVKLLVYRYLISTNNWNLVWIHFKKNINIPKYIFPSQLLSKFTSDVPVLVMGLLYSTEHLGMFVFALSILNLPVKLIDSSIRPIFYQKAVQVYHNDKSQLKHFFIKSFTRSAVLTGILVFILASLSVLIFPLIFGQEWEKAGTYAALLSLNVMSHTLLNPYTDFWKIVGREKRLLSLNFVSIFLKIVPFGIAFLGVEVHTLLILYSLFSLIAVLFLLFDLFDYFFSTSKSFGYITVALVSELVLYWVVLTISQFWAGQHLELNL